MAVPHLDDDQPSKRWGAEVAFDDLGSIVADESRLDQYRERAEKAGRAAAARLRSATDDQ